MQLNNTKNKLIQYWVGKNLPLVHVKSKSGLKKTVADFVVHPVKRRLAKLYVFLLQRIFGLKVIAITGSAGKTSTKEMLAAVLSLDGKSVWSKDNIDPIFNIPNTILKTTPLTKYLILEMGVEYPMEMDFYLWLVKPDFGIITNIFPTHTLYFGDVGGVFKEKSKLARGARIAILNEDDKHLLNLKYVLNKKVYWFKKSDNPIDTNKNIARRVSEVLGVQEQIITKGLSEYKNPKHRLNLFKHKSGAFILDDTYNNNPEAMIATLKYFNNLAGKNEKILVVGDMLELGASEVEDHKRIAKEVQKYGFKKILGVGKLVKHITPNVYKSYSDVLPEIKIYLRPKTYILFKGSRSISLDKVVDSL